MDSPAPTAAAQRPMRNLPGWLGYAIAAALTVATLAARLAAGYANPPTLIIFMVPIMLSAYIGGLGPGLLATAISALAASYFLLPPLHDFAIESLTNRVQWVILIVVGATSSALFDLLWRARNRSSRAEEMLRESEGRYRTLFEYAPDGILIADSKSYYLDANPSMCKLLGYTREELIGLHASDIVAATEVQHIEPALEAITTTSNYYREWKFTRKDGSMFVGEVIGAAMPDGKLLGMVRDTSERRRADEALRDRDAADQANQLKSQFLANMSHELRTPLNAVIGFTGVLLMKLPGPLNADQEKQITTVRDSARHLLSLINDLLDVAKIESGKLELTLGAVDCVKAINEVAATLRPVAMAKGLAFETKLPAGPVLVRADERALKQILINLTNNAIKFTEHGWVCIELERRESSKVEIAVIDTGIGVTAADQAKLFQPFVRADGRRAEGTGLGLYLCRKLAEAQGGEIRLQSQGGGGTRVSVVLNGCEPVAPSGETTRDQTAT